MKYKEWLDEWFANYIEPSSKTKNVRKIFGDYRKALEGKVGRVRA